MKVAVCCAMNHNRSMEAHKLLLEEGFIVESYGTNQNIKIPGESIDKPNVYPFGTSYTDIYKDLYAKNKKFYARIGMLEMLKRNIEIKERAENYFESTRTHDIVITAEEKCFTSIFERAFSPNNSSSCKFKFLINFDIKDTLSDATSGAQEIKRFLMKARESEGDLRAKVITALDDFTSSTGKTLLFTCAI